jgi:phospholipid/cholesterol/gamma-HCH transport system substrate-binding protein
MATGNNIEFRVGVIVLMVAVLLIASLYWLQGYRLKYNSQMVKVRFNDVGTLSVGDRVTVSGVLKGKVRDFRLTESGVLVELQIYQDVLLKKDATFTIKNMGVMGERFVAINPGRDSLAYDASVTADGLYDYGIPEVMGSMGDMIDELHNLVTQLKQTVASDESMDRFDRTASNLESISKSLVGYLDRNEGKFDESATNFLKASRRINDMIAHNEPSVDSAVGRLDVLTQRLLAFTDQLDTLAASARTFADQLNNGDGTLQMLVDDRRLYDDLRKTAGNLDDLVVDIRANPGKYINLNVELF